MHFNKILLSKKINYTRHAKNRMRRRRISQADVNVALKNPDKIKKSNTHKYVCLKVISKRQIKVVFIDQTDEVLIITAFDKAN